MSWFSTSEVESQILKATSGSIPTGEQDLPLNLEISDSVRSKEANAKEVLRILKKRLYDLNPNVQILTLHLLDLLAKNGGSHFLLELTSKEFIDAYVAELLTLVNQQRNTEVVDLMLDYMQTWALASKNKIEAKYLHDKYEELKRRRDITFPEAIGISEISDSFLESATAPDWSDSTTCMKSGQPFTFYNRKHHCRNCGGVFLQEYCSRFRALPHFGINIPVRVCDDCDLRLNQKYRPSKDKDDLPDLTNDLASKSMSRKSILSNNSAIGSRYNHDIQQAINLSLQQSNGIKTQHLQPTSGFGDHPAAGGSEEEYDEELKRAIEESLAEIKQTNTQETKTDLQYSGLQAPISKQSTEEQKLALPAGDKEAIIEFAKSVEHATPHDSVYNPRLISLSQSGTHLQSKVISELRTTTNKLATLEDLHEKLLSISRYYDELLEAELNPDYSRPHTQVKEEVHQESQPIINPTNKFQSEATESPSTQTIKRCTSESENTPEGQMPNEKPNETSAEQPEVEPEPEPILIEL